MSVCAQLVLDAVQFAWAPLSGAVVVFWRRIDAIQKKMNDVQLRVEHHETDIANIMKRLDGVPEDIASIKTDIVHQSRSINRIENILLETRNGDKGS